MENNKTVFQRLSGVFRSHSGNKEALDRIMHHSQSDEVLFKTNGGTWYSCGNCR